MTPEVIKQLSEKEQPSNGFHSELLSSTKGLVQSSRGSMSKFYDLWDRQECIYRGEVPPDLDDRKAADRKQPTKMVVPNTFSQIQTAVSFCFLLFTQNQKFFELEPVGLDDMSKKREDTENVTNFDWKHNKGNQLTYQGLLDIFKYGIGIMDTSWTHTLSNIQVNETTPSGELFGVSIPGVEHVVTKTFTKYMGAQVRNISPYRFFPDTNFPLTEFERGEFVAYEEEYSVAQLFEMEEAGEVAGIEHIESFGINWKDRDGLTRGSTSIIDAKRRNDFDTTKRMSVALITKCQRWIVPKKFLVDGKPLGPESYRMLYTIWYANDNRIIRLEPTGAWHNEFSVSVAQFTPDMQRLINGGVAELISELQSVVSWLINSHITSVRRVISNRLIIDPKVVDTTTLDGEGDIYLKKGVSVPLDRAVGQLRVQDTTGQHMSDAEMITKIIEVTTGINGNMSGQYNSGRRSAQESRVVTAGAAGRMKVHAALLWDQLFGRAGRLIKSNNRQELTIEMFARIIGKSVEDPDTQMRFVDFAGTPESVVCDDDYFIYDSTLASEKGYVAQSLQELLSIMLSNPQAAQIFDISPKAVLDEIMYLRGTGSAERFSLTKRVQTGKELPPQMPPPQALPSVA